MRLPATSATDHPKKLDTREYLTSWKEIAEYMGAGVRTIQRYEREFGLPIRRPTGKSRGSVIATRAEIDAWIAAAPIREAFRLSRVERDGRAQATADKIERGINAMRKLKDQMLALRIETRSALNLLVDKVSSLRNLMPPSRAEGYEPLVNMNMDIDDIDMDRSISTARTVPISKVRLGASRQKGYASSQRRTASTVSHKPH